MIDKIIDQQAVASRVQQIRALMEPLGVEGQYAELQKHVTEARKNAKRDRDEALDGLSPKGLSKALFEYEVAIKLCNCYLRKDFSKTDSEAPPSEREKTIAKQLYQCLGSSGEIGRAHV